MFTHTRILNKIDLYDNWVTKNPILLNGELGIARKEEKTIVKIGDGETSFSALPSFELTPEGSTLLPSGLISLWSGEITAIPVGWVLCDGENGTPDLRDKFIIGAGKTYDTGSEGGEAKHTLTIYEMPSHNHSASSSSAGAHSHTLGADRDTAYGTYGSSIHGASTGADSYKGSTNVTGAHTHTITISETGGGQPHNNLPPYYALCYIMKI